MALWHDICLKVNIAKVFPGTIVYFFAKLESQT